MHTLDSLLCVELWNGDSLDSGLEHCQDVSKFKSFYSLFLLFGPNAHPKNTPCARKSTNERYSLSSSRRIN